MFRLLPKITIGLITAVLSGLLMVTGGCTNQNQEALETQFFGLETAVNEIRVSIDRLETIQAYQSTQLGAISPAGGERPPVVTTAAPQSPVITFTPSPTAYTPVYGSVEIEEGICCAGGQAGEEIDINVAFEAYSAAGEVVEMRVVTSFSRPNESRLVDAEWVSYQSEQIYTIQLAINWVGWWVGVQYRDDQGNLSPMYVDDISLEGH
jgi:hypothetical protein